MTTNTNYYIQFISLCILIFIFFTIIFNNFKIINIELDGIRRFPNDNSKENVSVKDTNPLDGCVYVYLDMGTNVGVQIR